MKFVVIYLDGAYKAFWSVTGGWENRSIPLEEYVVQFNTKGMAEEFASNFLRAKAITLHEAKLGQNAVE